MKKMKKNAKKDGTKTKMMEKTSKIMKDSEKDGKTMSN